MKRAVLGVAIMALAAAVGGSVFERFLSPDRPADRVIMKYLELAKSGKASSMELADLGVLILEKGFPGDAIDYLEAALKLDKHNYEAAYRLGLVLQREGKDREAAHYYKKTLKERPGYAQARFMLALAEERCGEREAAIHDYSKAYRYAPELANPLKNPLVYDSSLQMESMLRHYSEAVRTSTLKVTEIDPAAIRRMMEALPPPTPTPTDAKGAAPVASEPAKPQPGAAGPPAGAPPRGRPAPAPTPGGEAPAGLDIRPASERRPSRSDASHRAQPPTPQPNPVEPAPAQEGESAAPAPAPGAEPELPAPPAEPGSEEPKPTPTPTR